MTPAESPPDGLPRHVYVHAPFCARRCSYCDFAVTVRADPPMAAWAEAIGRELEHTAREREWTAPLPVRTLYLGGGTPSLLGVGAVPRLMDALAPAADLRELVEFTAEANPESFSPELARDWRGAGIDRISFGAQTFHEPSLRWMGRLHGPGGPARAVATARAAGFDNLGLDLIFGLPERLQRDLDADLDRILEMQPQHISIYGLSVEPDTPLGRWVAEGREALPDEDRYREEYLRVSERLRSEGYHHYEVSNFARPGREARHNAAYWSGVPYLGLGNGAHSFIWPERWWNHRDWAAYREAVLSGEGGRAGAERLADEAARLETVWLGLRTAEGLSTDTLGAGQRALAQRWEGEGLAERGVDRLRLTVEGWLLLDRLAVDLASAGDEDVAGEERSSPGDALHYGHPARSAGPHA